MADEKKPGEGSLKGQMRQVPFRMHENDYRVLRKLFADDGLNFQTFVKTCVEGYMMGDPLILKALKNMKELSPVPQEVLDRYTLSQRERQKILDDLTKEEDKEKIG